MARRYKRKTRAESQRDYRARRVLYEKYKESTLSTKTFKEWNEPYRKQQFLKKEFKLYQKKFKTRKKSARYGFRKVDGEDIQPYETFSDFKNQYLLTRNSLKEEVEMGERERIGSVITEMINDQAYELSSKKASAVADYLIREEMPILIKKKLATPFINEKGEEEYIIKRRNLNLLIRQGQFVEEEVGLWEEIKDYYKILIDEGYTARGARNEIGKSYFHSDPSKQK